VAARWIRRMTSAGGSETDMADKPFLKAIQSHAWSPDHKQLAVAPNSEEVFIYDAPGPDPTKWEKKHILTEHEGFVSALDWTRTVVEEGKYRGGGLVTCGHDRNAYVWEYDAKEDTWKPALVILRIQRAATAVKWSPSGLKFAVASGAKCIPVCNYEESQKWWVSSMIKKHKSTVTCLAWSPNSKFLLNGCADFKARISSAFLEKTDSASDDGYGEVFPKFKEFGETLAEFDCKGWVNAVAWAPGGDWIAFAGHSSVLTFVQIKAGLKQHSINCQGLPYLDIAFLDDATLIAVGFDLSPHLFKFESGEWKFADVLDKGEQKAAGAGARGPTAFSRWAEADRRGRDVGGPSDAELPTRHKNNITTICVSGPKTFTTSGLDGRVLHWSL